MARTVVAALALLLAAGSAAAEPEALRRLPALLHAHSTFSTGDLPPERLLEEARARGLEAVLLAENYLLRVEYGLWPFHAATRMTRQEPSVLARGVEAYLDRVAELRRGFPGLLVLPGVEVIPHYYWTGSPLTGTLTVHNLQKNLLVFGIADPHALKRLPSTGNPHLRRRTPAGLLQALPGLLLLLPGFWLLFVRRRRVRQIRSVRIVEHRRHWLAGALLVGLGIGALTRAFPFGEDPWSPYRPKLAGVAVQTLIDEVERQGGATVWSFPEARDSSEQRVLGLRVRVNTEPYPDDLVRTFRYTAFGGVYEETTRIAAPGGLWDYVLGKYLTGERSRPAWAVGESGFHGFDTGKRIGTIQTVFLVREKTEADLLESLRAGRMYALSRPPAAGLVLGAFGVRQGPREAVSGGVLRAAPGQAVEVRVGVEATDGGEYPLRAVLVRSGRVVQTWAGKTPFRAAHRETFDGQPLYFRLDVRGPVPHHLLSNPIFVHPG